MNEKNPKLSLRERDRRWRLGRDLMKAEGLDCLVILGRSREHYDSFFTNECFDGIVVFPIEGDPAYLIWSGSRIARRLESTAEGEEFWVDDERLGATGPGLAGVIEEKGFDQAKIGVVGLESKGPGELEGVISYKTWDEILKRLPNADFVDVSFEFAEAIMVKSEEELAMVRRSAEIGELACQAMIDVVKPGVSESEIYATVASTIIREGAICAPDGVILKTGPENVSWGTPVWVHHGGNPRVLKEGDVALTEIFPVYGGFESQQQMTVALHPVSEVHRECAEVAVKSYEAGIEALRPGADFQGVCDAMERPLADAGCWHLTPLIHTIMPLVWGSAMYVGIEQVPGIEKFKGIRTVRSLFDLAKSSGKQLTIKPGMVFAFEPNACRGKHRINVGGTVIVTESGVEELNSIPNKMYVLD